MNKVYIASPFFNEDELNFVKKIEDLFDGVGVAYYSPRKDVILQDVPKEERMKMTKTVYDNNVNNIEACDVMVAVIDNRDVGTMFEMGYAAALKKHIITVTNHDFAVNVMLKECTYAHIKNTNELVSAVECARKGYMFSSDSVKDVFWMLLLDRKLGQSIIIKCGGKEIKVTVVGNNENDVKLGFDADRDIEIAREEIVVRNSRNTGD